MRSLGESGFDLVRQGEALKDAEVGRSLGRPHDTSQHYHIQLKQYMIVKY